MSGTETYRRIEFSPWPEALAQRYRAQGLWAGKPLSDIIDRHRSSEATALICGQRHMSYARFSQLTDQLAAGLSASGLGPGDTALVQLPNIAEFYLLFFALLKAGIAPVNALYSHQRLELTAYAAQLKPSLLIASRGHRLFNDDVFIEELQEIAPQLRQTVLLSEQTQIENLADLVSINRADHFAPVAAGEVAFFQLSGGSTGTPKLIPRTHDDYYYSIRRSAEICELSAASRYLCALPAAHNYPLSSPGALGIFYAGGTVVMAPDPEPLHCFSLIEQHAVTMAALVPSAVTLWLQAAAGRQEQLQTLKLLQVGGASFAPALARRVPAELGCALQQVFGMAEGLVNYTRLHDSVEKIFTTQGYPMSDADEIRIINPETGAMAAEGETGMLLTRGPYTFRGYYRAAEHNADAFTAEGFYSSGDLVRCDADGYLTVVGRVKDQINRGGEKIAAEEIENLLLKHPQISAAALISVADDLLGEKSLACVVSRDPALKAVALRKYLRTLGIADYKLPDKFRLLKTLPLTAVGKTDKKTLRRMMAEQAMVRDEALS